MENEQATAAKLKGNIHCKNQEWEEAIAEYTKAIEFHDIDPLHTYYSNRSACYVKLHNFEAALSDGAMCVELKPNWAKGYHRIGFALLKLGKFEEAKQSYENAIKIDGSSSTLKDRLRECEQALIGRDLIGTLTDGITEKKIETFDENGISIDCLRCKGSGYITRDQMMGPMTLKQKSKCSHCNGAGTVPIAATAEQLGLEPLQQNESILFEKERIEYEKTIMALQKELESVSNREETKSNTNNNINDKEGIEGVLASLSREFLLFKKEYNQGKLEEIMDKTPNLLTDKDSSLNKQFNNYKQNIGQILLCLQSFNKHIQDIECVMTKMRHPNPSEYTNWNIAQMLVWIQHLDNGRYNKYSDILRNGFIESDIKGEDLPSVNRSDLSSPPFNIKHFRDKKDLETHFKSLVSQTVVVVASVNDTVSCEGPTQTAYV